MTFPKVDENIVKGLIAGSGGGLVASWIMNVFQRSLSKLFHEDEKSHGAQSLQTGSPQHGAGVYLQERGVDSEDDTAAARTANVIATSLFDHPLSERQKETAGTAFHYAFGITTGALYGATAELIPAVSTGGGVPFGAAVWLMADEVVVPALGLSRSPDKYPLDKHGYALASHLVYGVVTEVVRKAILRIL
jgi:putative membrane protein